MLGNFSFFVVCCDVSKFKVFKKKDYMQTTEVATSRERKVHCVLVRLNMVIYPLILQLFFLAIKMLSAYVYCIILQQGSYRQDSYRQVCVKFKKFSRLSYSFQGLKVQKNPDLHVKILFFKC